MYRTEERETESRISVHCFPGPPLVSDFGGLNHLRFCWWHRIWTVFALILFILALFIRTIVLPVTRGNIHSRTGPRFRNIEKALSGGVFLVLNGAFNVFQGGIEIPRNSLGILDFSRRLNSAIFLINARFRRKRIPYLQITSEEDGLSLFVLCY